MYGFFAKAIVFFYDLWPSYGGAIILLTLAIMIVLLPLTLKGTRSMIAMQRLQPELKKLQNRYKDDRAKLNEELLKFYKENKINPLGGCLPLLIQLPVFWVLYEVLLGLTRHGPFGADLASGSACSFSSVAASASNACHNGVYQLAGTFSPSYIHEDSNLWHALHESSKMMSFGIDLSQSPLASLGGGLLHALPYLAMILVVIATTYIQQKQIQGRTPQANVNPQQQMMMKVMPIVFAVIYVIIPAGVVVYFLVSNLFRIAQQGFITRSMYGPGSGIISTTATDTSSKNAPERRGFMSLLVPSQGSLPQLSRKSEGRGKSGSSAKGATATKAAKGTKQGAGKQGAGKQGAGKQGAGKQGAGKQGGKAADTKRSQQGAKDPGSANGAARASTATADGSEEAARGNGAARKGAPARSGATAPSRRPQGPARKGPPPPNRSKNKKKRK
jgi:YidC/Oxa1 family membrane protein insertase